MDDIFRIAKQLGVEEKEAHKLVTLSKVLSNPIVSTILGFIVGLIFGAFFPRTTDYTSYPYFSTEIVSGIGATRSRKKWGLQILAIIFGVIGFLFGFTLSSQLIFAERAVIMYGVFARNNDQIL